MMIVRSSYSYPTGDQVAAAIRRGFHLSDQWQADRVFAPQVAISAQCYGGGVWGFTFDEPRIESRPFSACGEIVRISVRHADDHDGEIKRWLDQVADLLERRPELARPIFRFFGGSLITT